VGTSHFWPGFGAAMTQMLSEVVLEAAEFSDLEQIRAIEERSFPFPWTDGMILTELVGPSYSMAYVAKEALHQRITGYVFMRLILDEIHLLNIAVQPEWRRKGVGELLLRHVFQLGLEHRADRVLLEVRPSNRAARALYEKHHFQEVGRRKRYYLKPTEDALLLQYDFQINKASELHPGLLSCIQST